MKKGCKPSIYLYPITPNTFSVGANDYIIKKSDCLSENFSIINTETRIGVLDIFLKFFKTDIFYFNWIEDIVDKSFGYLQVIILLFILVACRLFDKKVIWFAHNNVSHYPKNRWLKKVIRKLMATFSNKIFTHSKHLDIYHKLPNIACFDHPIEQNEFLSEAPDSEFDVLVWGNQSPYKGADELVKYNKQHPELQNIKFLIAGKFTSTDFYNETASFAESNIQIVDRVIEDDELVDLFRRSKYVLFCYNKNSILSSAALCKTLSYGKTIIGPNAGAFKELGDKGLIYTYDSMNELTELLNQCITSKAQINKEKISNYVQATAWRNFKEFLVSEIEATETKRTLFFKRSMA